MNVHNYIQEKVAKGEKLLFTLLDPEKLSPEKAADLAKKLESFGADAIMVGGSTTGKIDHVAEAIKDSVDIPIILFPSSALSLSTHADAVFFMMLINSNKREFLVGEQVKGSKMVKDVGIEPIGMGYIVINTGEPTTVEKVAEIKRLTKEEVVSCALAAQHFGMSLVYLEAGSGAQQPVPNDIITAVKKAVDIPVIVGGGINGPRTTRSKLEAGADIIVIGTVIEKLYGKVPEIIDSVKRFKPKK
jgi:phosphoglycerol geranylgeranyltransferase